EHAHLYCAYGAALSLLETSSKGIAGQVQGITGDDQRIEAGEADMAYYPPLTETIGRYPDFGDHRRFDYMPRMVEVPEPVEVDVYLEPDGAGPMKVYLGIDIGSTSTKAVLLDSRMGMTDDDPRVLAGFYTRTAGRPIQAVQAVFEAASEWASDLGIEVVGAGTTGSGRKFIGALVGADLVLDEITAHARAAVELDPEVDTIIEIGGQDSKFTSLSGGAVTQSVMNHVCAAGTGSFIEEQVGRLGCSLDEMGARTMGRRAPMASDRCTVFMERDLNHFLSEGYRVDEVLCSVLHAVRDNYLLKVARDGNIGRRICFQGATARNRSLVAAFEQKLEKPIDVSRYCHLTGALGTALELRDMAAQGRLPASCFRGLDLYRKHIPVQTEVCELCNNNCKIRLVEVGGEKVGFGYLCGRDPEDERYVSANSSGFDLLRSRRRHFRAEPGPIKREVVVGLPAALHMMEDLPLWRRFFGELGARTLSSDKISDPVGWGKQLAGAEFCAPVAAWHAHVAWLAERTDFVFTPFYLEAEHPPGERRQFCYYTQYAPALTSNPPAGGIAGRCISPLLRVGARRFNAFAELHRSLVPALGKDLTRSEVTEAYESARAWFDGKVAGLPGIMEQARTDADELAVVLLGRPYTALSPAMNAGIPDILAKLGVKVFYQDMLPEKEPEELETLLRYAKWQHARRNFLAAHAVATTPGLYPVLLTSFKCTPDACTLEHFRRIMEAHDKPYLVLQLDEYDSSVGYETRIEAALRSFSNHHRGGGPVAGGRRLPQVPVRTREAQGRILFVPPWDTLATRLFVAGLREIGMDARLLEETPGTIQRSLGYNTGQCIPLSIIVNEFVEVVRREGIDPGRTALWMPASSIGCNICFFPQYGKALLESIGDGFEKANLYAGEVSSHEISPGATLNAFHAYTFAGMLRRMQCRVRPYEKQAGETDRAVAWAMDLFEQSMLGILPKRETVRRVVDSFLQIDTVKESRPLVAVFGDLYTRDNDVLNQDLLRVIEAHGGEALTTPYSEYLKMVAGPYLKKWFREGLYKDVLLSAPFVLSFDMLEYPYKREFERVLGHRPVVNPQGNREEILARFGMTMNHTGESFDNLLKVFHLLERYPEIRLFVQTSPAFCCPSLVTEAMAAKIESETGVPVVTVNYDGTTADHNEVVVPYLELAVEWGGQAVSLEGPDRCRSRCSSGTGGRGR
ncbi:MAG: CoA activase, partial [Deltaproteobacteria bacterium]|nr:CoA activase [Deltaproteobacteria bacterium]